MLLYFGLDPLSLKEIQVRSVKTLRYCQWVTLCSLYTSTDERVLQDDKRSVLGISYGVRPTHSEEGEEKEENRRTHSICK